MFSFQEMSKYGKSIVKYIRWKMKIMTTCSKKSKFGRANNSDEL